VTLLDGKTHGPGVEKSAVGLVTGTFGALIWNTSRRVRLETGRINTADEYLFRYLTGLQF